MKININGIEIDKSAITNNLKRLTNQVYKLLPNREEGLDWEAPLVTITEEFAGMNIILNNETLFSLLCKLQGLKTLKENEDFYDYRRIIFECLSLIQTMKEEVETWA